MSAWYIFATLGIYPVNPVAGEFVRSFPQCKKITLDVPGTLPVIIERRGTLKQPECRVNKKIIKDNFIPFSVFSRTSSSPL
jgi:putative alpha-1,2-mannosidase